MKIRTISRSGHIRYYVRSRRGEAFYYQYYEKVGNEFIKRGPKVSYPFYMWLHIQITGRSLDNPDWYKVVDAIMAMTNEEYNRQMLLFKLSDI